jgi:hypothetical protein
MFIFAHEIVYLRIGLQALDSGLQVFLCHTYPPF